MKMGMQMGLDTGQYCKRSHRWMFTIPQVCGDDSPGANALPPRESARPSLSFKEMEVRHVSEDVYYPAKPDWKPITITLFDLNRGTHPVFQWFRQVYDPQAGSFFAPNTGTFITNCFLNLVSGCGDIVETWTFEDAWAQSVNFQNLSMENSGIVMCDISLRYARAYIS